MARRDNPPPPQYSESEPGQARMPHPDHDHNGQGAGSSSPPDERSSLLPSRYKPPAASSQKRNDFEILCSFVVIMTIIIVGAQTWPMKWQDELEPDSFHWMDLTPAAHCTQYAVREYTATLFNPRQPSLSHPEMLTACSNAEAMIVGRAYSKPDYCEFTNDKYIGHWSVEDLADCKTYFEGFRDVGCVASGSSLRRYEAHLMTLMPGDDGRIMCDTTPARLKGKSFSGPDSCVDWGKWGWWGIWWLEDPECEKLQVQL